MKLSIGRISSFICLVAAYAVFVPQTAHAYIDPGTGSLVLQAILAGVFGASFAIKSYWHKIKGIFGSRPAKQSPDINEKTADGVNNKGNAIG